MRHPLFLFTLACLWVIPFHLVDAQPVPGASGVIHVTDWPDPATDFGPEARAYEIAITIDSLKVGYVFRSIAGQPAVSMALEWMPGVKAILDGSPVDASALPDSVFLSALALQADVMVGNEIVARFSTHIDTMFLAPAPALHHVELRNITWDDLFENADSTETRSIFETGFQLAHAQIVAVEFVSFGQLEEIQREVPVVRRQPTRRSTVIFDPIPDIFIDLVWLFRVDTPDIDVNLPDRPRGERMGRRPAGSEPSDDRGRTDRGRSTTDQSETGSSDGNVSSDTRKRESGKRSGKDTSSKKTGDQSDDDDDDDEKLLPAAVTAAAAIGVLAYVGGTIGYSGTSETPIGLSAGIVRPKGGVLLQASVNEAVLGADGPEKLGGRLVFFGAVPSAIQPAVGVGLQVTCDKDECEYDPGFSLGAVGNLGLVVVQGGYDLALNQWQFGLSINFRAHKR